MLYFYRNKTLVRQEVKLWHLQNVARIAELTEQNTKCFGLMTMSGYAAKQFVITACTLKERCLVPVAATGTLKTDP